MSTLAEFLLARIAEDEAVARAARPGPWVMSPVVYGPPEKGWGQPTTGNVGTAGSRYGDDVVSHYMHEGGGADIHDATHIARHDPARVLAECAAKRRIVAMYESPTTCGDCGADLENWRGQVSASHSPTLLNLASVYADHPDYRAEWGA